MPSASTETLIDTREVIELPPGTYPHIPKLGPAQPDDHTTSLLPSTGGQPGIIYLQLPVQHIRAAQTSGWSRVVDFAPYTITGPNGSIDCELVCTGQPIIGGSAHGVLNRHFIHNDITKTTGLPLPTPPATIEKRSARTAGKPKAPVTAVPVSQEQVAQLLAQVQLQATELASLKSELGEPTTAPKES